MVALAYGTSAFDRERGDFPAFPVINMFAEEVPTEATAVLQSRPGLKNTGIVMGAGPVRALFQMDGVLGNKLFGLSGQTLYESGTAIGTIDGNGPATIAGFENRVFVNAGERIWEYDGTTLSPVTFPDGTPVSDICVGASRLIAIRKDTGRFYWSDPLVSTVNALGFATAENSPDKLRASLFLGDTLILFGSETVEFWPVNPDPNLPFQPLVGRVFQIGVRSTETAVLYKTSFAWVTNRNQICLGSPESVISTPSIEEKLNKSPTASLWTFRLEGIEFLALSLADETWVLSSRTGLWSTFESDGRAWIPRCSVGNYMGSGLTGDLVEWSDDHTDFGGILERRFRAGLSIDSATVSLNNLRLRTNPGQTPYLTGLYSDPVVEIRTSNDGGFEWSPWRKRALGKQGKYRSSIDWRSLGKFSYPGVLVEIRVTDPVPFRISNVVANEPYGGI